MDGNTGMEGWSGKQRILRREEAGGARASQEARLAEALQQQQQWPSVRE
jgi:hypothetical protein